jgi:phage RecT family recombinase
MNAPAHRDQSTAVDTRQQPNIIQILESPKAEAELARIAGGTIDTSRFAKISMTAIKSKWDILKNCDPFSIFTAVLEAAQLQLDTSVAANEFYFVPFGNTCTGMIGYRGKIRLIYRSGVATKVDAVARFAGDDFEYEETQDGPRWRHIPYWQLGRERGPLLFTYAYARLTNGEIIFKVADSYRIKTARDASKSGKTWDKHPTAMSIKTAVHELWKFLPKDRIDPRVAAAMDDDEAREVGGTVTPRVSTDWAPALFGAPPSSLGELSAAAGLEPDATDAKPRRVQRNDSRGPHAAGPGDQAEPPEDADAPF